MFVIDVGKRNGRDVKRLRQLSRVACSCFAFNLPELRQVQAQERLLPSLPSLTAIRHSVMSKSSSRAGFEMEGWGKVITRMQLSEAFDHSTWQAALIAAQTLPPEVPTPVSFQPAPA